MCGNTEIKMSTQSHWKSFSVEEIVETRETHYILLKDIGIKNDKKRVTF